MTFALLVSCLVETHPLFLLCFPFLSFSPPRHSLPERVSLPFLDARPFVAVPTICCWCSRQTIETRVPPAHVAQTNNHENDRPVKSDRPIRRNIGSHLFLFFSSACLRREKKAGEGAIRVVGIAPLCRSSFGRTRRSRFPAPAIIFKEAPILLLFALSFRPFSS